MSVPTTGPQAPTGAAVPGPDRAGGAVQATFAATVVDEWVRAGLTHAVVCPGSRSTPLALALAARPELRLHVRLDERGAGFFAVGVGLATGRPAIVCTTSGTAAAELHPAVVEAHHAGVPLLVCTADRPPELHHVGAGQTIDQVHLFGSAVRWFADPGVAVEGSAGTWRALAARAVQDAVAGPGGPGPVHLNLAFRDPLVAEPGPLPPGRAGGGPYLEPQRSGAGQEADRAALAVAGWPGRRGMVVAGAGCGPPDGVVALAGALGWPLLADPRSGCRVDHPNVVAAADALLRPPGLRARLLPEVVVVLGAPWTSKAVAETVAAAARAGAEVVAVDPFLRRVDPDRAVTAFHHADPAGWVAAGVAALAGAADRAGPGAGGDATAWLGAWRAAEAEAQRAITDVLAGEAAAGRTRLSEPALARMLPGALPAGTAVVAASSMSVRELEWFAPVLAEPPVVLSNRGANGIDGVGSTAQGVAAAGPGAVVGLLGDLAFLHDVSSLVRAEGPAPTSSCTLVVVDNGGGGIFNFLPQAATLDPARFELLFGTPQSADVVAVAQGFGLDTADVGTAAELRSALGAFVGHRPLAVVRVRVPGRADNAALHERIHRAVALAAGAVLR